MHVRPVPELLQHDLFVKHRHWTRKPEGIQKTIASLPPIGCRGELQLQLYPQLQRLKALGRSGIHEITGKGLGWDFSDVIDEGDGRSVQNQLSFGVTSEAIDGRPDSKQGHEYEYKKGTSKGGVGKDNVQGTLHGDKKEHQHQVVVATVSEPTTEAANMAGKTKTAVKAVSSIVNTVKKMTVPRPGMKYYEAAPWNPQSLPLSSIRLPV